MTAPAWVKTTGHFRLALLPAVIVGLLPLLFRRQITHFIVLTIVLWFCAAVVFNFVALRFFPPKLERYVPPPPRIFGSWP
jgi:hypothetical protein